MTAADLWDVPGQQRATAVLRRAVAGGGPGHAWAFLGPAGVGQEAAARALAAALNCPSPPQPGQPCGACSTCRRCARGAHPAYREFVPTGTVHRVDEVRREWLHAAMRSASEGAWKVLHVRDADRMNEAAANAFLKALEEPPEATVWVLDLADPDELPDTILSRCRGVRFAAWTPDALLAEAARAGLGDEAERRLAVRAALGSPVVLRRLAAPGGLDALRLHRSLVGRLRAEGPGHALVAARALADEVKTETDARKEEARRELAELATQYGDSVPRGVQRQVEERHARREREARIQVLQAALDDLVGWLRDCLLVACGGAPDDAVHADAADALRADADALRPAGLLAAVDAVVATRDALELNVQTGVALEALFLELSTLALTGPGAVTPAAPAG